MLTILCYLENRTLHHEATVVGTGVIDGRQWVLLDETIFHYSGGGQPADSGKIGQVDVLDVRKDRDTGTIMHFVTGNAFLPQQRVSLVVDAEVRVRNSRCHSAGHLIAAVVEHEFPQARAIAGHHWPGEARVEFEFESEPPLACLADQIQEAIDRTIDENRRIDVFFESGGVRYVQIHGFDPVQCGGTHVAATGELERVTIKSVRKKAYRVRISYDCG
jgi:alanyl-tRNA synthetase